VSSVSPLSKGEKTRLTILHATLRVIASAGRRGVTHRAVAKEAGVSLSLTTYYFKDLSELLIEAFTLHKAELHKQLEPSLAVYRAEAEVLQKCRQRGDLQGEQQVLLSIADQLSDFVVNQVETGSQGLVVEMAFFFDMHMPENFRRVAYELRQRFVDDLAELCEGVGSDDPFSDAEIIIGTIQRLQYEALSVPDSNQSPEKVRKQLRRLLRILWVGPSR
tara:strand:- start:694 stop:1350 length:657 start_codon:yes stop_codon:yes gene_type:complete